MWKVCELTKHLTPHFFVKVVKLYVISDDGSQAAVAELRRADKLEDEVKEGVTSFRGGFEESVPIWTMCKEKMTRLGVELGKGRNGINGEIEEVMLEGI